jgi:hypothetical protein
MASQFKEHSEEIAASGASLVWSNIDVGPKGEIYWYDPMEGQIDDGYTKKEAATVLEGVAKWLLN